MERPWNLEDRTRLASALLFGPRLGLTAIDALFQGDEGSQQRAYSLSAAVVRHLMAQHGRAAPAGVLRELARGWPFEYALASVTAQSPATFEAVPSSIAAAGVGGRHLFCQKILSISPGCPCRPLLR